MSITKKKQVGWENCKGCGKPFPKTRNNKEHCNDSCRTKAWRDRNLISAKEIIKRFKKLEDRVAKLEEPEKLECLGDLRENFSEPIYFPQKKGEKNG